MVPAALYKKVLRFIISPCYVSIGDKEYIQSGIAYLKVYKTIFSPFDANDFTKFILKFNCIISLYPHQPL